MSNERMPWFKWWDGTVGDLKFRMVAEECKLPVACIVGAWAYLLEHASRSVDRGSIGEVDYELMAYTLGIPDCETVCNAMKRRKLLHETGEVTKWDDRQGKRERHEAPGASTERVRKMRERQKMSQNNGLQSQPESDGNATNETHVTPCNAKKRPREEEEKKKSSKPKPSSSADAAGDGVVKPFDQFWEVYPHKVGKQDAQKAWAKLKPDAELVTVILAAVEAQKSGAAWMDRDGQYIPHPATWLNGGRWLDVVRAYVPPPLKLPPGWWETKEGLAAAGAMLTPPLTPRPGEYPKDFAQRIRAALGQVDPAPGTAPAPAVAAAAPAQYEPPAPPDDVQLTPEQRAARREEFKGVMAKLREASGMPPIDKAA